jgi:hypothetical protein
VNFPTVDAEHPFLLDYDTIANAQENDIILQQFAQHKPELYIEESLPEAVDN